MARRPKPKSVCVRLNQNGKVLNFSSSASTMFVGFDNVDIFENDHVIAVQAATKGQYHISSEKGRLRKALSNAQLIAHLCKKFGCELGASLPAWVGDDERVLFFGGIQPEEKEHYILDETYTPVEVEYNRRAGSWAYIHDNWIEFTREVRDILPRRLSVYRCGNTVLLLGDSSGKLVLTPRRASGNLMLVSHPLASFLRHLYNGTERGMRLCAATVPGGVALAENGELLDKGDYTFKEKVSLDERTCAFLNVGTGKLGSMYLSAYAWQLLGRPERLSVYIKAEYLALKPEKNGQFRATKCGYAQYIHTRQLCAILQNRWPGGKKIYLLRHENLWVLLPDTDLYHKLPPASSFERVELGNKQFKENVMQKPCLTPTRGAKAAWSR